MSNQSSNAPQRETFSGRGAFIMAAIGSAVGLGNIWRFPYTTYENGGGAFILPYIIALLTAGLPLLFLDYSIGHKYRGGAPLSFRRFSSKFETFGWWQVLINVIIGIYYAVVLGWAASYTYFSFSGAWGDKPVDFFIGEFLKMGDITQGVSFEFVGMVTGPLIAVWPDCYCCVGYGDQKRDFCCLKPANAAVDRDVLSVGRLFINPTGCCERLRCVIYPKLGKIG